MLPHAHAHSLSHTHAQNLANASLKVWRVGIFRYRDPDLHIIRVATPLFLYTHVYTCTHMHTHVYVYVHLWVCVCITLKFDLALTKNSTLEFLCDSTCASIQIRGLT
jgi:hypothetical protein